METPVTEGFYWARWIKAVPGTREGDELTPGLQPEVMYVFVNCLDKANPEYLMVEVPGVERAQSLDCFEWLSPRITLEVVSRIAELEAEVTRLRDENEHLRQPWQPMATAPRDGTEIQAIIPGHGQDNVIADSFYGWQFTRDQNPPDDWDDGICWEKNGDGKPSTKPIAWKHLPKNQIDEDKEVA